MSDSAPGTFFDAIAEEYDSISRRALPVREEMLGALEGCFEDGPQAILELGCGTGALTARLVRRFPDARIRAIDASAHMLDVARRRLSGVPISFEQSRFEDLDLAGGAYDLIASNMSLHHIVDKTPFYRKMRRAVRPDGLLVLGDELKSVLPFMEERFIRAWRSFAGQPGGLTDEEFATIDRHIREIDHYETLPRQLELLGEAGFEQVDCVWRHLNYGVFVCRA